MLELRNHTAVELILRSSLGVFSSVEAILSLPMLLKQRGGKTIVRGPRVISVASMHEEV